MIRKTKPTAAKTIFLVDCVSELNKMVWFNKNKIPIIGKYKRCSKSWSLIFFGTKKIGNKNKMNHAPPNMISFVFLFLFIAIIAAIIKTAATPHNVCVFEMVGNTFRLNGRIHLPKY